MNRLDQRHLDPDPMPPPEDPMPLPPEPIPGPGGPTPGPAIKVGSRCVCSPAFRRKFVPVNC